MKKYIFAIILFLMAFGIYSCTDSLGIDPNVQKYPINDPGNGDDPPASTIYESPQKNWSFNEQYHDTGLVFEWKNNVSYQKNSVKMDTSSGTVTMWVDLEVESTFPDYAVKNRNDRVVGFRMILDSLPIKRNMQNNSPQELYSIHNFSFKVFIKDLETDYVASYNQMDLPWMLTIYVNEINGTIYGSITIGLLPRFWIDYHTKIFYADFTHYYR